MVVNILAKTHFRQGKVPEELLLIQQPITLAVNMAFAISDVIAHMGMAAVFRRHSVVVQQQINSALQFRHIMEDPESRDKTIPLD